MAMFKIWEGVSIFLICLSFPLWILPYVIYRLIRKGDYEDIPEYLPSEDMAVLIFFTGFLVILLLPFWLPFVILWGIIKHG